jgi:hypothetical protein
MNPQAKYKFQYTIMTEMWQRGASTLVLSSQKPWAKILLTYKFAFNIIDKRLTI